MTQPYMDLLEIAGREPLWWDEVGVPRFKPFEPDLCNDVYADEAALVVIECAACHRRLRVAMTWSRVQEMWRGINALSKRIEQGAIHYGDAPCWRLGEPQCAGTTMNSDPLRVVEFWTRCDGPRRPGPRAWVRRPELEIIVDEALQ